MKLLAVICLLLIAVFACGGDDSSDPSTSSATSSAEAFPQESDWEDCDLPVAGPLPEDLTPRTIPGRCATQEVRTEDGLLVTEVEEWLCADFSGVVAGYSNCVGELGRFTYVYLETDKGRQVVRISGQFPPDLAQ
jgi:hypothetical protein